MCVRPLRISNPKLNWTMNDQKYLTVPCGKCVQCRARAQQEWFIRGYFEYLDVIKNGGSTYACCLTYSDEWLPKYEDKRDYIYISATETRKANNPVSFTMLGFDNNAILKFMKLVRIRLKRKYNINQSKFFIAAEYGSKTHRPHYHCLVYLPKSLSDVDFFNLIDFCWKYGFVSKDKRQSWKVKSANAIKYAAKYVTKDLYFYDQTLSDYLDKNNIPEAECQYRLQSIKNYLPRFHCSQHFGECLADQIKSSKDPLSYLVSDRPVKIPKKNGKLDSYSLPKYIEQKLKKAPDKEISTLLDKIYYRTTKLGSEAAKTRLNDIISKDCIKLKEYCNSELLKNSLSVLKDRTLDTLCDIISEQLLQTDITKLVKYRHFLRFIPVGEYRSQSRDQIFTNFNQIYEDFFAEDAIPYELYSKIRDTDITMQSLGYSTDRIGLSLSDMEEAKSIDTFSDTLTFRSYEHICQLLDEYDTLLHNAKFNARQSREDKISDTKFKFSQITEYGSPDKR